MNLAYKKPKQIYTSRIVLLAFSTLFFSRTIDALGAPSLINFAHFALVPAACGLALLKTRTHDQQQITATKALCLSLIFFLAAQLMSALANGAGILNVILNFLLLAEPFLMLLALASIPLSAGRIRSLKNWVVIFALYNLGLAYFQRYILGTSNADFIYGAFFSVAGATVSAIVSIVFSFYYLVSEKQKPLWVRLLLLMAVFWQLIISDTKLVFGSCLVGYVLFTLTKLSRRTLIYIIFGVVLFFCFLWGLENLPFMRAYSVWLRLEFFTDFNSEFYRAKLAAFRVVPLNYDSSFDWLFGLGPGHGVGRLGGWMIAKYSNILTPLGITHPFPDLYTDIVQAAGQESRHVAGTAMFGPLFSWAGIWSDLGIFGLGSYLLIWWTVWRYFCLNDLSKYLVMVTFSTAFFPGYLEEPGSMLFTTFIIALYWHELRFKAKDEKLKSIRTWLTSNSQKYYSSESN